jgi:hypothetical protein
MLYTRSVVAMRRVKRYRAKAAELRRQARITTEKLRVELAERAEMFDRIVETAERDMGVWDDSCHDARD